MKGPLEVAQGPPEDLLGISESWWRPAVWRPSWRTSLHRLGYGDYYVPLWVAAIYNSSFVWLESVGLPTAEACVKLAKAEPERLKMFLVLFSVSSTAADREDAIRTAFM